MSVKGISAYTEIIARTDQEDSSWPILFQLHLCVNNNGRSDATRNLCVIQGGGGTVLVMLGWMFLCLRDGPPSKLRPFENVKCQCPKSFGTFARSTCN